MDSKPRVVRAVALILAFPVLVAFQLVLLAFDAPGGILAPVALMTWFVGPVLVVVGALMILPRHWTFLPSTRPGRLSLWLLCAVPAFVVIFFVAVATNLGPDAPEEFFDNLYLALPISLAGVCAVGAGALAAFAILRCHERSLLAVGAIAFGLLVAFFTAAEIAGHDEPGNSSEPRATTSPTRQSPVATSVATPMPSATTALNRQSPAATSAATPIPGATTVPNSHSNVSVVNVASGLVRVSFDYTYAANPNSGTITAITVSPLDRNRQPLTGYEPRVLPISRGSGHLDVTLSFTQDELVQLNGFSICFTGPGVPNLGCAMTGYGPN